MPTTGQTAVIPNANSNERCKWWPVCKSRVSVCGGFRKFDCKLYGTRGTIAPPSQLEFDRLFRQHTWEPSAMKRNCAYYPFCKRKAWDCGGFRKEQCTEFKPLGSKEPPSDTQLRSAKGRNKRKQQAERREEAKK